MSAFPVLPTIVSRAFDVSRRAGYVSFCRNETGRLLAALAATRTGTLAEFGTGCGVGTAWLRSGVPAGSQILSAELDPTDVAHPDDPPFLVGTDHHVGELVRRRKAPLHLDRQLVGDAAVHRRLAQRAA